MSKKKNKWEKRYDKILSQGITESTRKGYERNLRYFWAWVQIAIGRRRCRYPVKVEIILRFIIDHFDGLPDDDRRRLQRRGFKVRKASLSPATIKNMLNAVSIAHREAGKPSSVCTDKVRLLMKRIRRAAAGRKKNKKAAITGEILEKMIATCTDGLRGVRDRAILLLGFSSGGRRRSEIHNIHVEDLRSVREGYILTLRKSKTDQEGEGKEVPIIGKAAQALDDWLQISEIKTGQVFRSIKNDGSIHESMSDRTIARMVKKRIALIGLNPDDYSAHSIRSGFITESGKQGASLKDAMQLSHHTTIEVAGGYYREGELMRNPAAHLIDRLDI